MTTSIRTSIAAALAVAVLGLSAPQPAKADTTSTLLIGAAAAAIGLTAANVINKNNKANASAGYLSNGDHVYQDGHVVTRSGQKYYPSDRGDTIQCQNNRCTTVGTNGSYKGHHYGMTHHHG
jgi:hypothetical protein